MDWSQLPADILQRIAGSLDSFADRLALGFVCRAWRSALSRYPAILTDRLPWLLLHNDTDLADLRSFFNLSDLKIYTINAPEVGTAFTCGSTSGCLLACDFASSSLRLSNPITREHISLPPVPPALLRSGGAVVGTRKAIGSLDPSDPLVVMLDVGSPNSILCYRQTVTGWTEINHDGAGDFTYYKGLYYILTREEATTSVIDPETRQVVGVIPSIEDIAERARLHTFLVRSSSGEELFLVIFRSRTRMGKFEVFRLDRMYRHWSKTRCIGSDTLFLDGHHGIALPARDGFRGCRGNCIVFLYNVFGGSWDGSRLVDDPCFGLFDIGNDREEPLLFGHKSITERKLSSWFIPGL